MSIDRPPRRGPDPDDLTYRFTDGDSTYTPTVTPLLTRLVLFAGTTYDTLTTASVLAVENAVAKRRDSRYKYALLREPTDFLRRIVAAPDVVIFKVFDTKAQADEYAESISRDWQTGAEFPKGSNCKELLAQAKAIHRTPTNGKEA